MRPPVINTEVPARSIGAGCMLGGTRSLHDRRGLAAVALTGVTDCFFRDGFCVECRHEPEPRSNPMRADSRGYSVWIPDHVGTNDAGDGSFAAIGR
jgi:hypothetical protein